MLYTLLFVGVAVLEVMGMIPQEIKSSGITIEGILSKYFGDEVGTRKIKLHALYIIIIGYALHLLPHEEDNSNDRTTLFPAIVVLYWPALE